MSAAIPFRKMNGIGNEIVVVDLRGSSLVFNAGQARAIALYQPIDDDELRR